MATWRTFARNWVGLVDPDGRPSASYTDQEAKFSAEKPARRILGATPGDIILGRWITLQQEHDHCQDKSLS